MCTQKRNVFGRVHSERVAKIQTCATLLRFYSGFTLTAAQRRPPKARARGSDRVPRSGVRVPGSRAEINYTAARAASGHARAEGSSNWKRGLQAGNARGQGSQPALSPRIVVAGGLVLSYGTYPLVSSTASPRGRSSRIRCSTETAAALLRTCCRDSRTIEPLVASAANSEEWSAETARPSSRPGGVPGARWWPVIKSTGETQKMS